MSYYVDPTDVTKYDRTEAELELYLLFCIVVAGKTAITQAKALERFLLSLPEAESPFDRIALCGYHSQRFYDLVEQSRLGQYKKIAKAFQESVQTLRYSLSTCSLHDLMQVHGIGPKTARFFLIHTRRDQKHAALDTHIMHYLRDQGITKEKGTPGKSYGYLEEKFLELVTASGKTVAEMDLEIWRQYSGN